VGENYLREIGCGGVDCINLAQDRGEAEEGSCEHGSKTLSCIKGWRGGIVEQLHNWKILKMRSFRSMDVVRSVLS
jgi:hypothetical protein